MLSGKDHVIPKRTTVAGNHREWGNSSLSDMGSHYYSEHALA